MAIPGQHPYELQTPEIALRSKVAALERRVSVLERENRIALTTVANITADTGRDGSLAGSTDTPRLWLKINGVWRYTALT